MPLATPAFLKSVPPWAILGIGAVMGSLKSAWDFIYKHTIGWAINKVSLSITVEDNDHPEAYAWMGQWVEKHLKTRGISSLLLRRQEGGYDGNPSSSSSKQEGAKYALIPGYGTYYMRWKSRYPMLIEHWPDETPGGGGALSGVMRKMHWLKVQVWFTRDRNILLDILAEAKAEYLAAMPPHVKFYRYTQYDGWSAQAISPRSLDSTYYPQALLDDILTDIRTFLDSKEKYAYLGIPYRHGYQLDGPPGTGKSTMILALASHLNLPLYSMSLQAEGMDGQRLQHMLSQCSKPAIVVFEDIDCLNAAKTRDVSPEDRLTMSDLLNAIDGIGAAEDRIIFMTSNHPEKVDVALTRSGRIDRKFHITYAADTELRRFYDNVSQLFAQPSWEEFRASLPEQTTIADAQAMAFHGKA
jgi:chaperone BCS1